MRERERERKRENAKLMFDKGRKNLKAPKRSLIDSVHCHERDKLREREGERKSCEREQ